MPHLIENSWRWLSHIEQSHSAQHIQTLPSNWTKKKDFQLRSDDVYPEMKIYILVLNRYSEQASRVSWELRTPFPLNLLQPGSACTLLAGKRCEFGLFQTMEGSTLVLPTFDWVLKPHWIKRHNTYLLFIFFFFLNFVESSLTCLSHLLQFWSIHNGATTATMKFFP